MTPELAETMQSLTPGDYVVLYLLDLSPIGVPTTYYFSPSNEDGSDIVFGGQAYSYVGINVTGIEWSADGTPSQAKLYLPNVNKFGASLVSQHQDLVGAKLTRIRTFRQFLDGEPMADTESILSTEIWVVEQKVTLNKQFAEFALQPLYDVSRRKLPGRVCLKSTCTHQYRVWDSETGQFDYTRATCPYVGSNMFKRDGTSTTNGAEDECPKDLTGCKIRFGEDPLPTRAFPGMSRIRI